MTRLGLRSVLRGCCPAGRARVVARGRGGEGVRVAPCGRCAGPSASAPGPLRARTPSPPLQHRDLSYRSRLLPFLSTPRGLTTPCTPFPGVMLTPETPAKTASDGLCASISQVFGYRNPIVHRRQQAWSRHRTGRADGVARLSHSRNGA